MNIEKEGKFVKNEKRKNLIIIILSILVGILFTLLILSLTGVLNFENDNTKQENNAIENDKNNEEVNNEDTTSEYANWMNYLLETDIQKITITRMRSESLGDKEEYNKTVELTIDELKEQFTELSIYEINNIYIAGNGGPSKNSLEIEYLVNGEKHTFNIYGVYISTYDEELLNIFKSNNYKESGLVEHKDLESIGRVLAFTKEPFSIFDKYFETK